MKSWIHSGALAGALTVSVVMLGACATTSRQERQEDESAWSFVPQTEARKFYLSGLSVNDYIKQKKATKPIAMDAVRGFGDSVILDDVLKIATFCQGLIMASDPINTTRCREAFVRDYNALPAEMQVDTFWSSKKRFQSQLETLDILSQQLLIEQGRAAEAEQFLLPYFDRPWKNPMSTMDQEKLRNYTLASMAMTPLVNALRIQNKETPPSLRRFLEDYENTFSVVTLNPIKLLAVTVGTVLLPKTISLQSAYSKFMLGDYDACYTRANLPLGLYEKIASSPFRAITAGIELTGAGTEIAGWTEQDLQKALFGPQIKATCAYESGRWDAARKAYEELLELEEVKPLRGTQRTAHWHLAQIALKQDRRADAVTHLKAAIDALEAERAAIDTEAGRMGYATNKSEVYATLIELLLERNEDAAAFEYAERGKARALLDVLASKRSAENQDTGPGGDDGALSRALQDIDRADAGAALGIVITGTGTSRSVALRQQLAQENVQLGSLLSGTVPPADEIKRRLHADETLIEYFGEGDKLFAFVVRQTGVTSVKLDARAVSAQARALRASLTDGASDDYLAKAKALYDSVLGPVMAHAGGGRLTIVPHGELNYIPFAALHDGQRFLVEKDDIRLLPSASVLAYLDGSALKSTGLMILGNPDLGDRALDLPGAEEEARALQRIDEDAFVLLRGEATETALRQHGAQYRNLHFAMHGRFDSDNALASGLYMARDEQNDGILSVADLYDLQLNAELVVLSACETALGDTSKGNDIVGLNRGFLFAGARSIVSSLWEVDDNATRDLMVAFYRQRAAGDNASALRRAQTETMRNYPHPYYWAAFQLSGAY